MGYYRKQGGTEKEVDVVVELPQGKILTEVKYRENVSIKENEAIVEIAGNEILKEDRQLFRTRQDIPGNE